MRDGQKWSTDLSHGYDLPAVQAYHSLTLHDELQLSFVKAN